MRALILIAGAALAVAACDKQPDYTNTTNTVVVVNEDDANTNVVESNTTRPCGEDGTHCDTP
jgi:uncharacterized lipoprotein YajG